VHQLAAADRAIGTNGRHDLGLLDLPAERHRSCPERLRFQAEREQAAEGGATRGHSGTGKKLAAGELGHFVVSPIQVILEWLIPLLTCINAE